VYKVANWTFDIISTKNIIGLQSWQFFCHKKSAAPSDQPQCLCGCCGWPAGARDTADAQDWQTAGDGDAYGRLTIAGETSTRYVTVTVTVTDKTSNMASATMTDQEDRTAVEALTASFAEVHALTVLIRFK